MEGCCTVAVSLESIRSFPTLLQLSTKEVVAIWDAVSEYILGQLKLNKGVLITGLGTFAMVRDRFQGEEGVYTVRRPVFQLEMDMFCVEDIVFPTVVIPDDVTIKPLNYRWLSRATSFPQHVVEGCVRETVLLYSFQLRNRQHLSFAFKDIGVLSCKDDVLCMRFYYDCVTGLEGKAGRLALLRSRLWAPGAALSGGATTAPGMQDAPAHAFPRFQLTVTSRAVAKALSSRPKAAAERRRSRRSTGMALCCPGAEGRLEKLLQRRARLSLPVLPSQEPGNRQQDMGKKTSARVLPPCPGSSPSRKEAGRQEPAPPAKPTAALPSSAGCRRALQEVRQLSADWQLMKTQWQERRQQAEAEQAAREAWSAGDDRQPPQDLGTERTWIPHPPAQPKRKEAKARWRRAENPLPAEEMAAAAQLERLHPEHLSPRAAQVLTRLEPHQVRRDIFKNVAEINRRRQEQQRQLPW